MKLNREQELAYLNEPYSSVTANAGSGKTAVLVDKYLKILREVKDPSRIIAFTFTNKAASELSKKVNKKLVKLLDEEKDSDKREELLSIKNKFIQSRISTIHSFCSKLVREYPVELGLSPSVKDLSKVESQKLLKKIVKKTIKEATENELKDDLNLLLVHFDTKKLEDQLIDNIRKRHMFSYLEKIYSNSDDDIMTIYKDQLDRYHIQEIGRLKNILNELLKSFSIDPDLEEKLILLISNLDSFKINELFVLAEELGSNKYKIGRKLIPGAIKSEESIPKQFFNEVDSLIKTIRNSLKTYIALNIEKEEIPFFRALFNLSTKALENFQAFKISNSLVDYNDLLIYAGELLSDEDINSKILKGFDYLFIDEFQDTSFLQYDVISKLAKIGEEDAKSIFIVGDTKQSIYGFNNADVRIFKSVSEDLAKINKNNKITLKTSYRLFPIPAMFVNDLMNNIMLNTSEYDVDYDDLIVGIDDSKKALVNALDDKVELDSTMGEVEFLLSRSDEENEDEILIEKESDLISKKILELISNEDYTLNDITVLARNTSKLKYLIRSFDRYGITYESFGNKNLFKKKEITDLISYLSFLLDPYEDLNFAILLKSYFFGRTDEDLLRIKFSDGDSLYEKFRARNSEDPELKMIDDHLDNMIRISKISSPVTIAFELLSNSLIMNLLNSHPQRQQILANINKVLNFILKGEEIDNSSLHNLVLDLEDNHDLSDESEADINIVDARVKLSTVHASKGLEYRCVILFNTDFRGNSDKGFRIDETFGFFGSHFKNSNGKKIYYESPLKDIISNNIKIQDHAENKRLLYVALTRCKEKLILSASFKKNIPESSGFASLILKGLKLEIDDLFDMDEIEKTTDLVFDNEGNRSKKLIKKYKIKFTKDIDINIIDKKEKVHEEIKIPDYTLDYKFKRENITASKLNHFIKDEDVYFDRYFLGLPEFKEMELKGIFKDVNLNDSELVASLKGTVFHEVMENIKYFYHNKLNEENLHLQIKNAFRNNKHTASDTDISEIDLMVKNVLKSDFIKDKIQSIKSSEMELELRWYHNEDFLFGSIDLLYNNGDEFEVWDWKTNNVKSIDEIKSTALTYEMQMKLYIYLVSLRHPDQDIYRARLLFTQQASNLKEWVYTFEFTKEDIDNIKDEIDLNVNGIRELAY